MYTLYCSALIIKCSTHTAFYFSFEEIKKIVKSWIFLTLSDILKHVTRYVHMYMHLMYDNDTHVCSIDIVFVSFYEISDAIHFSYDFTYFISAGLNS